MQVTMKKIGVLGDMSLLMYSYETHQYTRAAVELPAVLTFDALLSLAHANGVDCLWMVPGSLVSRAGQDIARSFDDSLLGGHISKTRQGAPRFAFIWRLSGTIAERKSIKMAWPEHDTRWPWASCFDPGVLLRSILYLQDALSHNVEWSPGHTGQAVMLDLLKGHDDWLAPSGAPIEVRKNLATDMQYKRPLTDEEKGIGMHLHLFDKDAQYLAACTAAKLGEGSPLYVESPLLIVETPGIWKAGDDWKWTPEWEGLFASGQKAFDVSFDAAWLWPKSHQTLRTWGEYMWGARQALKGGVVSYTHTLARQLAYEAIKPIYTQGMGWLAMITKGDDNKLYRPDWWSMIVATARRNMVYKIRQLGKLELHTAYVNVDTLGLVSYGVDIGMYKQCLLNRQGQLGAFKHVGSVLLTQDIIRLFSDDVSFRDCQNGILAALDRGQA